MQKATAWVLAAALSTAVLSAREFTGKNGKTIEAEIVSKTSKEVELELEDGRTVKVPITSLSDADQLYVEVWESPEEKERQLKGVDLDAALKAKGFVGFPVTMDGQFTVVKLQCDGTEVALMVGHANEEPLLDAAAAKRLGFELKPIEGGGGGQLEGTFQPEKFGNGSESIDGARFLVAALQGLPEGIDGIIGGQFFIDHEARLDFSAKKLWLKD